jgi:hypothetical protein
LQSTLHALTIVKTLSMPYQMQDLQQGKQASQAADIQAADTGTST